MGAVEDWVTYPVGLVQINHVTGFWGLRTQLVMGLEVMITAPRATGLLILMKSHLKTLFLRFMFLFRLWYVVHFSAVCLLLFVLRRSQIIFENLQENNV